MDKLLIIADDFTGALDTGIQFTKMGICAKIITDYQYDFSKLEEKYSLLVVNTDSRPLSPEDAYKRVFELAAHAREAGFQYVYKKTDSGLRGNIGMELKAVMDAYEVKTSYLIPALPSLNRVTRGGVQYIDGIPVKESVFGKDLFEPVLYSDVAEIIQSQFKAQVVKISKEKQDSMEEMWNDIVTTDTKERVLLFDAKTDQDLIQIAEKLKKRTTYQICAGCAGFAAAYDSLLDLQKGSAVTPLQTDGLLALCGSVNAITVQQLDFAEKNGFKRINLLNEQKLDSNYMTSKAGKKFLDELFLEILNTDKFLVETLDRKGFETVEDYAERLELSGNQIRFQIADTLGMIATEMVDRGLNYTISMTGGDTLMGFMRKTNTTELVPICEIGKGAVMSVMTWAEKEIQVISKSGGFGEEDIFLKMYEAIANADRRI